MKLSRHASLQIAAGISAVTLGSLVGCSGSSSSSTPAPAPTPTAPVISAQPAPVTVVSGGNATFSVTATGNGALSYQWRKDGVAVSGATSASLALTAVTAAQDGTYECVVINTLSSTAQVAISTGVRLAVNTAPVIVAQPANQAGLAGASVNFSVVADGNGTLSYQWLKGGVAITGATGATYSIAAIAAGDAASYTCVVTNTLGSTTTTTTSAAATVTVTAPIPVATAPVLSAQPAPVTVLAGGNAAFTVTATGNGALSYQWRKDGAALAGANAASLALTAVTAAQDGIYDCILTNTLNSTSQVAISTGVRLAVNTAPVILAQPANQAAPAGGSVSFTVVASGNGTLSYQWLKGGLAIAGATSSSYGIAAIAAGDEASYSCVVTNTLGATATTTNSAAATVTLSAAATPVISAQPVAMTMVQGDTASFSVTATGSGVLTYQWYKNGTALTGATASSLNLATLALADAATYTCLITNTVSGVSSVITTQPAVLVVVGTPTISAQPVGGTLLEGVAGSLSVTAAGNGTLSYQWRKDGSVLSGATSAALSLAVIAATDAGSYDCVVTNTLGGVSTTVTSAAAVVVVNVPATIATQPVSVTQVEADSATLTIAASASNGTLAYQWYRGATALANGGNIAGADTNTLVISALAAADAASYTCVVTRNLNGSATTVTSAAAVVTVNLKPVITLAPVAKGVATGSTATFSVTATGATGAVLSYQWRKTLAGVTTDLTAGSSYTTPSISGASLATYDGATYDCVITSTLNATTATTTTTPVALSVAVLPTLTIASSAGATPNNFAGGEAAPTLTATVTNTTPALNGTVTYQWKKGTIAILGATSAAYTLPAAVSLADAGSYTCSVSNTTSGATATGTSSAIQMNVIAAPVISSDLPATSYKNGTVSPTNGSLSISATAPAGGTLSYAWQVSTDGGLTFANVAGATTSSYAAPAYPAATARSYRCIVTNTVGTATAITTSSACLVTLYQTAAITTQPVNTNAVAGTATSLTVVPAAITIAGTVQTIQWYKGITATVAQPIAGATSATLSFPAPGATDGGYYYCIVTNGLPGAVSPSNATSSTVRLGVNTAPSIATQPPAAPIATEGTSFSLTTLASGGAGNTISYQWRKAGVAITGATAATYTIPAPAAGDAASYDCVITSTLGALAPAAVSTLTATTNAANLVVNLKPTSLTPVVTGNTTTGPVTLTVTPTNPNTGSYLTYQWKRNNASISGAVNSVYTINELTTTTAGNYTCDVSSVFQASGTSSASTATATSPIAAVGVGTGVTTPVVTLGSAYTAGKTGILVSIDPQAGAAYEWSVSNGSITAGAGTNAITVTAGTNTSLPLTLTVVVTKATGGAVGFASAAVVAAITTPSILAPAFVHPGDTWMKASTDTQTGSYLWTLGGAGTITGSAPANLVLLPFSANGGAVNGDTITLTANVQNAASDASPTATKAVTVTTGTWLNKDGGMTWTLGSGSNMNGGASAVLANGRVLVCGGQTLLSYSPATSAIYDPATRRWTRVADMNFGRTGHTATALNNGTILVTGGTSSNPVTNLTTYLNNAEIYDPIANTWTVVLNSTMGAGRAAHTATLLTSGANVNRVAIIGGLFGSSDRTNVIALFQPSGSAGNNPGGSFSIAPQVLNLPRAYHTSTILSDGRVLIVGGQGATSETYTQTEILDLQSSTAALNSCARVASPSIQGRLYQTATLLQDGKVLIAGGSQSPSTAELFDPATGSFTATTGTLKGGNLAANTSGRNQHRAVRLADGRVLLTGGQGGGNQGVYQSTEVYTPGTGLFTNLTSMNNGRYLHTMEALPDGTVMVLGGSSPILSGTNTTEIFDPAANVGMGSWSTVGSLNSRNNIAPIRLADGRVLVAGGFQQWQGNDTTTTPVTTMTLSRSTQLYDPATHTWTNGGLLVSARYNYSGVLLSNGKVLVAGGIGPITGQTYLATAELFDPTTNTWSSAASMNVPRSGAGIIALPDGKALVMGGLSNGAAVNTSEIYDSVTNTWATTTTTMSEVKYAPLPILLSNGKVVVAGGNTSSLTVPTAAVELFDPATQAWSTLTPLAQIRDKAYPFALPNGKFVLLGGRVVNPAFGNMGAAGAPGGLAGALEIYDTLGNGGMGATLPTTSLFFKTEARLFGSNSANRLPDGRILLAGGSLTATAGSTSEIYDPVADTLTAGPALTSGQGAGLMSVTLANGDVMLIGGDKTDSITQIFRF